MAKITTKVEFEIGDYVVDEDGFEGYITGIDGDGLTFYFNTENKKRKSSHNRQLTLKKEPFTFDIEKVDKALSDLGFSLSDSVKPEQADALVESALLVLYQELKRRKITKIKYEIEGYICPKGAFGKATFEDKEI